VPEPQAVKNREKIIHGKARFIIISPDFIFQNHGLKVSGKRPLVKPFLNNVFNCSDLLQPIPLIIQKETAITKAGAI